MKLIPPFLVPMAIRKHRIGLGYFPSFQLGLSPLSFLWFVALCLGDGQLFAPKSLLGGQLKGKFWVPLQLVNQQKLVEAR